MIHYHGTPLTPTDAASRFFRGRHAMVSFAYARGHSSDLPLIAEVCQSFVLDNGAFSAWKSGAPVTDWSAYYSWVREWSCHPGFDWALIPDVIDGDEGANDALIDAWPFDIPSAAVPVWHLHESIDRLVRLCGAWPRVALGSSGEFATIGTQRWWRRMAQAMDAVCHEDGFPVTKLHGLRMLDPRVFSVVPFASADSTNVARNVGIDSKWRGSYAAISPEVRAFVIADRVEARPSADRWLGVDAIQQNLELLA